MELILRMYNNSFKNSKQAVLCEFFYLSKNGPRLNIFIFGLHKQDAYYCHGQFAGIGAGFLAESV